ncbi:ferredoxin-dependent glutamate synthase 2 [Lyngbya aestuarii BL J]|uniref:glutamate synthase (ferredoxin) n=2 Tax=Lyngbya aestuarii BL J TaxID=1348334 RepID=U7QEK2_9CYAN|nr:glutamate synthase large subunit [Lyngbya aestuarii]ERT05702.1 ferredoxin-dependent glutamate synthase 2 [Lyngbya aestuarii BL J]
MDHINTSENQNQPMTGGEMPETSAIKGFSSHRLLRRKTTEPAVTVGQGTQNSTRLGTPYGGQRWLVEERDACGVGFIANPSGVASHDIIEKALPALTCLEHRGGCSADYDSGDGAGLMSAIPWELLQQSPELSSLQELSLEQLHQAYGVAMVFLPPDEQQAATTRQVIEEVLAAENLTHLGWRKVPVNPDVLGPQARENQPLIEQVVVSSKTDQTGDALERQLYLARRSVGDALEAKGFVWGQNVYICSFSCRTIVYKGMVRSAVLGEFYLDLKNPAYKSAFAVYHRRFSTNTMPRWPLAQPMRLLGHNGEINTLLGNINWMRAAEGKLASDTWGERLETLKPFVDATNSDSANLDNVMELLVRTGRTPLETLMIMVPEAYKNQPDLQSRPEIVDFYEYYSGLQEPWDGPALLVFSDGKQIGATLDRNGLRPARYCITKDNLVIVASEAGVVDIPESEIVEKGRLGPGQMLAVDLESHEVLKNWEIKERIARRQPYHEWLENYRVNLEPQPFEDETSNLETQTQLRLQTAFGYGSEDLDMVIADMASLGKEPTFCMGDDIPLAVLSDKPHLLYDYFKQRFAQVTNPPIDPLREWIVMSLNMQLGGRGNLLDPQPENARMLKIESPVLNEAELEALCQSGFETIKLSTLYPVSTGPDGLEQAIKQLCDRAEDEVRQGKKIVILSDSSGETHRDRNLSAELTYIPPLLAVGAVHHHLITTGLRCSASLVVETAQCWSTHHFACLIGYGASAVCPYLAFASVRGWWSSPKTQKAIEQGKLSLSLSDAQKNYRKAVEGGLLKILSKMGISLLSSYQGAQIFEAIGISGDLLELGFKGTTSRIGGLTVKELSQEIYQFQVKAFPEIEQKKLENYGFVNFFKRGEYHSNNPELAKVLHQAVRSVNGNQNGSDVPGYDHYQTYQKYLEGRPISALRDLLDFQSDHESIPLDEVESVVEIVKRFCTGGMSLGALSPEAHETLAIAMNRLGGKSNSGEGGEDPARFKAFEDVDDQGNSATRPYLKGLRNGDSASSAIKQVASGRFGVTPEYLMNAHSIEIKIAQGAKPGEGGQLPGKKVSAYIAMLRRSKAGVTLISPPPHHDIYSIEDLAQLIFDLHQINPQALVSVKLVAEIGIGTIAAGVAKANADYIQISGHDGGTGASPLSSIKHAGTPWELGLTEVHRVLMENKLRDRVRLRVDGGLKSGWDVVMGALMGAEEFGFGTIAMIAEGCIMARICHTNSCPVGVTTQREDLRKRFPGTPDHVVNFFYLIAEEVRQLLARLGYRSLTDIMGRSDLLKMREGVQLTKTSAINLDCLINLPDTRSDRDWLNHEGVHSNGPVLDDVLLEDADIAAAIRNQGTVNKTVRLVNTDRTVGARIAGKIAAMYGNTGFSGQISLNFTGSAGQSFGAFNLPGMTLTLTGEANDYVGKGMHGGELIIKPSPEASYDPSENVIIGNTCLYGATGGTLYALGQAGERFAVRNSMGRAVIEGAGDHCCEYMTGGVVVVLGAVGRNVAAGQTGGIGYFLDENNQFPERLNGEIVKIQRVCTPAGEKQLKELIEQHAERTGSQKAQTILANWSEYLPKFWQVVPPSEENTPEASAEGSTEKVAVTAS